MAAAARRRCRAFSRALSSAAAEPFSPSVATAGADEVGQKSDGLNVREGDSRQARRVSIPSFHRRRLPLQQRVRIGRRSSLRPGQTLPTESQAGINSCGTPGRVRAPLRPVFRFSRHPARPLNEADLTVTGRLAQPSGRLSSPAFGLPRETRKSLPPVLRCAAGPRCARPARLPIPVSRSPSRPRQAWPEAKERLTWPPLEPSSPRATATPVRSRP